ncbi:hypothetical protein [Caldalkalibacillus mannanilyticus]|uniref:hypothetical protein n=1 Tax=Caldalkalibacillus mannanilyticus TaxID=1418 RepID=UPI00046A31B7|nr:hypothetical protein [Caldalkalibacillus mannanilyticus]
MLKILKIHPEDYPNGKKVWYKYTSDKYFDVNIVEEGNWIINLKMKQFDSPFEKELEVEIFEYAEK